MICTKCNINKTETPEINKKKIIVPLKPKEEQFNILVHHNKFFTIFHNIVDKINLK